MKLLEKFNLKNLKLKNRLVMPPMLMYHSNNDGSKVENFHIVHYTQRAIGQVGLIIVESTAVVPNGRISNQCMGLWDDNQVYGMKKLVDSVHEQGSSIALQINHAGRKSRSKDLRHIGPSEIKFNDEEISYEEVTKDDIKEIVEAFRDSAKRADEAGFDGLEIHAAHGYLIHQFISPLSNQREDEYGKDRFLFLKEVVSAVKEVWPKEKALWMRISATDYHENGLDVDDWIEFLNDNENLVDAVHVSAGGIINVPIDLYPGYMLGLASRIKNETNYTTIGVGMLNNSDIINYALESESCDLVACGRELLRNPNLLSKIASENGRKDLIHPSYTRAF